MRKTFDAELLELSRELTSMAATARAAFPFGLFGLLVGALELGVGLV